MHGTWNALQAWRTADLLGCSIDYMLGRDVPEKPISDVPNLGTGWRTGAPDKAGTYAVIGYDGLRLPSAVLDPAAAENRHLHHGYEWLREMRCSGLLLGTGDVLPAMR